MIQWAVASLKGTVSWYKAPDVPSFKMTAIYWRHCRVVLRSIKTNSLHNIHCHGAILSTLELNLQIFTRGCQQGRILSCYARRKIIEVTSATIIYSVSHENRWYQALPPCRHRGAQHIQRQDVLSRFILMKSTEHTRQRGKSSKLSAGTRRHTMSSYGVPMHLIKKWGSPSGFRC